MAGSVRDPPIGGFRFARSTLGIQVKTVAGDGRAKGVLGWTISGRSRLCGSGWRCSPRRCRPGSHLRGAPRNHHRRGRRQSRRSHPHTVGQLPRGVRSDFADLSRRRRDRRGRSFAEISGRRWRSGTVGFFAPYFGVLGWAHFISGWPWAQAQIAGIALSTTSVAVVYAVMVETGFNNTEIGKIILAACFINDIGTVLALGLVFANYDIFGCWPLPRRPLIALSPLCRAGRRGSSPGSARGSANRRSSLSC